MLTVHLEDLVFHAHHGVYSGESAVGNSFQVSLSVSYDEENIKLNDLQNVINYEDLYNIVKKKMAVPTPLLEEVAESIIRKIRHSYANIKKISITILKLNAPIEGIHGKVGITLTKKFD
ncbi:dihydroneopterin aldolase [Pinibacter soli]|uniref:7,8-dihydroneopterin aldolase n=1 Tax=Pinibacter soli TaxID=3044211 RepID=A0ABT6REQ1_9BACT|nr:dihydroneopterin aldolase [Pinibacter soli]MDI3321052.1 dihydroneopterin aldolase [Pinibacter soli]